MFISGDDRGNIIVWDSDSLARLGRCSVIGGEVSCLCFLDSYPAFVCSDAAGGLNLWSVRPYLHPYHLILRWKNYSDSTNFIPNVLCVSFVHFFANGERKCYLYTGDEKGNICIWDLSKAIQLANLIPMKYPIKLTVFNSFFFHFFISNIQFLIYHLTRHKNGKSLKHFQNQIWIQVV